MATLAPQSRLDSLRQTFDPGRIWRQNPPLAFTGAVMIVVLLATLVGLVLDPRTVINEAAWMKPTKFALSIVIYSFTLLWLMSYIEGRRRLVAVVSWIVATALVVEQVVISYQAFRGVRSHFNYTTAFDAALFQTMAIAIAILWVANVVVAVLLLRQRFVNPVMAWALRFGLIVALLGMAVAFMMPRPTPAQEQVMDQDRTSQYIGAHSVGVEDGGPGLPIVGWSTVGGDFRVPHFFGIHAMQALPVVGWLLLAIPAAWLTLRDRARLMVIAGFFGLGLVSLLTWQARRGQSLIAPDGLTLAAFFGGLAVAGLAAMVVVLVARRRGEAQ